MNYDINGILNINIEIPALVLITAVIVLIPSFSHHYSVTYLKKLTANQSFQRAPFAPNVEIFSLAWLFLSAIMAFCYNRTKNIAFLVLMCFNLFWAIAYAILKEPALGLFILFCNLIFAGYLLITVDADFAKACLIVYMIYVCYSIYLNYYVVKNQD